MDFDQRQTVLRGLRKAVESVSDIPDPGNRAGALVSALSVVRDARATLIAIRLGLIMEYREMGMTDAQIGAFLDIDGGTVAQIRRGKHTGRKHTPRAWIEGLVKTPGGRVRTNPGRGLDGGGRGLDDGGRDLDEPRTAVDDARTGSDD